MHIIENQNVKMKIYNEKHQEKGELHLLLRFQKKVAPLNLFSNTQSSSEYMNTDRGIQIVCYGEHYKLTTKAEHKQYYQKLVDNNFSDNLSESALEVLSIIAYNRPITRIEIDEIRGTNSSYIIRKLLIQGLIIDEGRSSLPGKPKLYTTTEKFLDCFGLKNISDLPKIEIKNDYETKNLYESKYNEKK